MNAGNKVNIVLTNYEACFGSLWLYRNSYYIHPITMEIVWALFTAATPLTTARTDPFGELICEYGPVSAVRQKKVLPGEDHPRNGRNIGSTSAKRAQDAPHIQLQYPTTIQRTLETPQYACARLAIRTKTAILVLLGPRTTQQILKKIQFPSVFPRCLNNLQIPLPPMAPTWTNLPKN